MGQFSAVRSPLGQSIQPVNCSFSTSQVHQFRRERVYGDTSLSSKIVIGMLSTPQMTASHRTIYRARSTLYVRTNEPLIIPPIFVVDCDCFIDQRHTASGVLPLRLLFGGAWSCSRLGLKLTAILLLDAVHNSTKRRITSGPAEHLRLKNTSHSDLSLNRCLAVL